MNLVMWNPLKKRSHKKRRNHPKAKSRRRRRHSMKGLIATVRRNPHRRRGYGRNPIGKGLSGIGPMVMSPAIGAAGALGADILFAKVPFLAALTPRNASLAKAALALGVGLGGRKFLGDKAVKIADGILTIEIYNVLYSQAATRFPTLGLPAPMAAVPNTAVPAAPLPAGGVSGYMATNVVRMPRGGVGAYHNGANRGAPTRPTIKRGVGAYFDTANAGTPGAMGSSSGYD